MTPAPPATTHIPLAARDQGVEAAWRSLRAASTDTAGAIDACTTLIAECRDERRSTARAILAILKGA